jgi:adenosylcobinamide-phosphate synthase
MDTQTSGIVVAIAAGLDYLMGDPWNWLHPVQVMGWGIHTYRQWVLKSIQQPWLLRLAGLILALGIVGISGAVGWWIVHLANQIHWLLALVLESILLASCFAGRSLRAAAGDVLQPLSQGDLDTARERLSRYVGRETAQLSEPEILRAILETVTENATDGVMAPLFYALLGLGLAIAPVSLALAYKASSTLDSMVGYRDPPYTDLGWFSARLDDVLTWLPCRLTVLTIALLSGKPLKIWRICQRDAPQDPSPNAGWSECAYAAALGVQVGGANIYRGKVKYKPLLGDSDRPITPSIIQQATHLTRYSFLIWLTLALTCVTLKPW